MQALGVRAQSLFNLIRKLRCFKIFFFLLLFFLIFCILFRVNILIQAHTKEKETKILQISLFFFTSIVFYLETCFIKREYAIRRKIIWNCICGIRLQEKEPHNVCFVSVREGEKKNKKKVQRKKLTNNNCKNKNTLYICIYIYMCIYIQTLFFLKSYHMINYIRSK